MKHPAKIFFYLLATLFFSLYSFSLLVFLMLSFLEEPKSHLCHLRTYTLVFSPSEFASPISDEPNQLDMEKALAPLIDELGSQNIVSIQSILSPHDSFSYVISYWAEEELEARSNIAQVWPKAS